MTRSEIYLSAMERGARVLFNFAVETAAECGGIQRAPNKRLVLTALREIWRLSRVYDAAEQRARSAYPTRDHC